jgi:hypothetical protein
LVTQTCNYWFVWATKIIGQTLVNNLTKLIDQYGLRNKIIAYVKDEGTNLNTMSIVLKFVVKCEFFGLDESFQGACFVHVFSKACQSKSHWLLSNALQSTITMCLKFKEEIINPFAPISLIDDDFGIAFELYLFTSNIISKVYSVLDSFISFLKSLKKEKFITCFL